MLLLIIVIALLAYIKGRAIGAKSQKAKILKAISHTHPQYTLGHLNQDLAIQEELEYEQKNRWKRMISDILKRFKEL